MTEEVVGSCPWTASCAPFSPLLSDCVWREQEIQEYVLKATGGASSSDPFEVSMARAAHCGVSRHIQTIKLQGGWKEQANACCELMLQGMSPEEINQYVEKQGQIPAL